ncbi:MAG: barnase inhibitor [Clostridiales bacterium]|jgi:ribonuclease inhibitor|nr:barnase inhibitor [Clostridiales bacterium]
MNLIRNLVPKERVLDFSECEYLGELHQVLMQALELPEWYGQNLSALWDVVTGYMYVPADITIIYKPKTKKSEALSSEIKKIVEVFQDAKQEFNEITLKIEM